MVEPAGDLGVEWVDAVDRSEWEDLLDRDPGASVLQHPRVTALLAEDGTGGRARYLEVRDRDLRLVGGLGLLVRRRFGLERIVSGAAGLYGGPVLGPERAAEAGEELARSFAVAGGARALAREMVWAGRTPPPGRWAGLRPLPTSVLEPPPPGEDFEESWVERLRSSRRKERRRLERRGYRAGPAPDASFLELFHPLYAARCAEWGTRPLEREVLARLLESDPRWQAFVVHDAEAALVGAHLCVDLGDELFAWLGTARRIEGGSAASLLIEAELRWCHERGRRGLNLGTSADLAGVVEFKKFMSAVDEPRWIVRWHRGRGYR